MPESANNSSTVKTFGGELLSIPAVLVSVPLFGLLVVLSILANCLVVVAFRNNPKLQTITNYFIVSLAASDLLIGIISVPLWMRHIIRRFPNVPADRLHKLWVFSDIVGGVASIFNLSLISYERYLCISTPLITHLHLTKRKAKGYVSVVWLLSLGLGSLRCAFGDDIPRPVKEIFFPLGCFLLPLAFMSFNYLRIFKLARRQMHKMNTNIPSKMTQCIFTKELKAAKAIGVVIGVFFLCWTPFFVLNLLYGLCSCWVKVPYNLILAVKWLHYLNSVLNPLIYTWRNQDFRTAFSKLVETSRRKVRSVKYRRTPKEPEIQCDIVNQKERRGDGDKVKDKNCNPEKEMPQKESSV